MRTKVHYTWIGKPRTKNILEPEQDLVGILKMSAVIADDVQLQLWCLDEYVESYRALLSEYSNISVCSIEKIIEKNNFSFIADIHNWLTTFKLRGFSIRDRVTMKELFSLLILYLQGGYTLDTNVAPLFDHIHFPELDYRMGVIQLNYAGNAPEDWDVWALSSRAEQAMTEKIIRSYLEGLSLLDNALGGASESASYKSEILNLIIEVIIEHRANINPYTAKHLGGHFPVQVQCEHPKIVKRYGNSHQANRLLIPPLHLAAAQNNVVVLETLLKKQDGLTMLKMAITTDQFSQLTPCNIAAFYGNREALALLLRYGASGDARFFSRSRSLLDSSPPSVDLTQPPTP